MEDDILGGQPEGSAIPFYLVKKKREQKRDVLLFLLLKRMDNKF